MKQPAPRLHYAWIVLGVGTFSVFGALGLGRFGYTAVLPAMQKALALSNTQTGFLATANLVGYLLLSALGGALAARYRPRNVIAGGLALAGIGMALTGLSGGFTEAAAWRTLTGIGSGAANVSVMGLLSAWFSARRRGTATGIGVSGSSVAIILIGPLVPFVVAAAPPGAGWRLCWFLYGGITLMTAVAARLFLRDNPAELGLAPYGWDAASPPATATDPGPAWRLVYRSLPIWHLGLVYTAFGFAYIIYMTFFTKSLIADRGYTQTQAGNLLMLMGWFSLLCGLTWGAASDIIGRQRALVIVYVIQAAAMALFAAGTAPTAFAVSAVLFGLTAWSIPAIMAAACGDVLGPRLAPAGLGFITLFFGMGQAAAPSIAGSMADRFHSFSPAFLLAGAVSLLGALGAATLHPSSTRNAPPDRC